MFFAAKPSGQTSVSNLIKKVITRVSNCVSTCENLGTQANSSQAGNCESGAHNYGFLILSFDST